MSDAENLRNLYHSLGATMKEHFIDWKAAIFTGNPDLGKNMGIRAHKKYAFFNGAIPCQLLLFDIIPEWFMGQRGVKS